MYQRLTGFLFLLTFCSPFSTVAQDGPISYTAKDSITSDVDAGTVELFNEVHLTFGETKLDAGYAKIFWEEGIVVARGIENRSGDIEQRHVCEDGGKTFYLSEIKYNWTTEKAKLKSVNTEEDEHNLKRNAVKQED